MALKMLPRMNIFAVPLLLYSFKFLSCFSSSLQRKVIAIFCFDIRRAIFTSILKQANEGNSVRYELYGVTHIATLLVQKEKGKKQKNK